MGTRSLINVLQTIYNIIYKNARGIYAYFNKFLCIKCIKYKMYLHIIQYRCILMHKIGEDFGEGKYHFPSNGRFSKRCGRMRRRTGECENMGESENSRIA